MNFFSKIINHFIPEDAPDRWRFSSTWDILHPVLVNSIDRKTGDIFSDSSFSKSIEQPIPYCYHFPLFSEAYCDWLVETAEKRGKWKFNRGDDYTAWEQYLVRFPFVYGYHKVFVLFDVLNPIIAALYGGWTAREMKNAFFIKYEKSICEKMDPHHDDNSLVSVSINLNDTFEGGGLKFVRYPEISVVSKKGWVVMFAGNPIMQHEALPVTAGRRYVLVYWVS